MYITFLHNGYGISGSSIYMGMTYLRILICTGNVFEIAIYKYLLDTIRTKKWISDYLYVIN